MSDAHEATARLWFHGGAAHAWAAPGHMLNAGSLLDEQAREHAGRSLLRGD